MQYTSITILQPNNHPKEMSLTRKFTRWKIAVLFINLKFAFVKDASGTEIYLDEPGILIVDPKERSTMWVWDM